MVFKLPASFAFIALVLAFAVPAHGQRPVNAADTKIFSFMPEASLGLVHVNIADTFKDPSMKFYPTELIQAVGEDELGFNPLMIKSIDIAVGMPGPNGPAFGGVVTLTEPVTIEQLNPNFIDPSQKVSVKGKDFYPFVSQREAVLHQIDSTTYLIGTQPFVQLMLAGPHTPNRVVKFAEMVNASQANSLVIIDTLSLRPLMEGGLEQVGEEMPPQVANSLSTLAASTDMVAIRVQVSSQTLQLLFQGADESTAIKIETSLNDLFAFGKAMALQEIEANFSGDSKEDLAMKAYINRISGEIVNMLKPKRTNNRVICQLSMKDQGQFVTLGIGTGLLLPAIQAARASAQRVSSQNNLRQIAIAILNYEATYGKLPANIVDDETGEPLLSWRVAILPFIEEQALYEEFHLDEAWDSPHNMKLLARMPQSLVSPGEPVDEGYSNYVSPTGEGIGVLGLQMRDMTDGSSNTISVLQVPGIASVPWSAPQDLPISEDQPLEAWNSVGAVKIEAAFSDASVRTITTQIDPEQFWGMLTPAGGELLELLP